jgi:hypothetical protein
MFGRGRKSLPNIDSAWVKIHARLFTEPRSIGIERESAKVFENQGLPVSQKLAGGDYSPPTEPPPSVIPFDCGLV